jgi:hypothetical protein
MKKKNPVAAAMGRKGGRQRAKNLSAEELSAQGRKAVLARWGKLAETPSVEARDAIDHIAARAKDLNRERREQFLALAGSLSEEQADELRQKVRELREHWR